MDPSKKLFYRRACPGWGRPGMQKTFYRKAAKDAKKRRL
jgi:hypothetical protein